MWSQTFKESVLDLVNKPAPWVEWGQAFLFLAYGLVILATGGDWLRGELFTGEKYDVRVMGLGVLSCLLSGIHAYGIAKEVYFIRSGIARAATLLWMTLLIYYYRSPTHKIGTVMCLLWVLFNFKVYLWVAEIKRRVFLNGRKPRDDSRHAVLQRARHGSGARIDFAVVEGARRTASRRAEEGAGGHRGPATIGDADTRGLPSYP